MVSNETSILLNHIEILFNCCYYINIEWGLLKLQMLESYIYFLLRITGSKYKVSIDFKQTRQVQGVFSFSFKKQKTLFTSLFKKKQKHKTFYFGITLNLPKSYKHITEFPNILHQLPLMLTFLLTVVHLSKLRNEYWHNSIT